MTERSEKAASRLATRAGARLVFYGLLLAGLVFVHLRLIEYAFDDAYIHIRIADRLITIGRPYFNVGEPVMAGSSPLWTLVLAAVFGIGGVSVRAIAVLNAICTTSCIWIYGTLLGRAAGAPAKTLRLDALAALTIVPILAPASVGLMETPLALLTGGAAMLLAHRDRPIAFFFFALAAFLRLELSALLVVFAAAAVVASRIRPTRIVLWSAAGTLPLVGYDLYFFGTVIPHAVRAKSRGYDVTLADTISRLVPLSSGFDPLASAIVIGVALVAALYVIERRPRDWVASAASLSGGLIFASYLTTLTLVFAWYVPLYAVLICIPLLAVVVKRTDASGETGRWRVARLGLCGGLWLVFLVPAQVQFSGYVRGAVLSPALAPSFAQGARVQRYIEVGQQLHALAPGVTLMTSEVGGLGYGFPGRIDDAFGLVSPRALSYHPMAVPEARSSGTIGAIPPSYVGEVNAPIVVGYDVFTEAFRQSEVAARYVRLGLPPFRASDTELAHRAGTVLKLWDILTLDLFIRRDIYDHWLESNGALDIK